MFKLRILVAFGYTSGATFQALYVEWTEGGPGDHLLPMKY
jgi:hypothetical protein